MRETEFVDVVGKILSSILVIVGKPKGGQLGFAPRQ
jgi:hypothetical protein